jgi:toxin ParE1/3/4
VRLEWSALARDDLLAIITAIATDKPTAARKFKVEVEARVSVLPSLPEIGKESTRYGVAGLRELVVHKNYVVFYRFDAARVEIVAVIHAHRKWP